VKRNASEMGLVTEIFRRMSGVKRSLHPTHSVCALGPLAEELTATHHLAPTRTGHGTPFEVMARKRCVIAGLGVEYFRVLTQTHTAEDMLGDEFPVKFEKDTFPVTMLDWKGNKVSYELCVLSPPKTLDNTLLRSILRKGELREWNFRGTRLFVTFADRVTKRLIDAARQGLTVYGVFSPRTPAVPQSKAVTFQ
jgi:aminoglycoside 3-N-acetyltransferase